MNFVKFKNVCSSEDTSDRIKRQLTEGEKKCVIREGLTCRT